MMISANEARIKTEQSNKGYKKELTKIEKKIEEAIALGEYSINGGGAFSYRTIQELRRLGYRVGIGEEYGVTYYCISWREQD